MIELSRHIEILLLDNDCVIVPGFGGFMAHHREAEYDEESTLFYPPQRTLGFNPHLQLNDSLLVQSYVEAYDISYPEATRKIDSEVEEIRQQLAVSGSYEFHGIGTITLMADGKYSFEPCSAGILSPTLYALNSFDFERLDGATVEDIMPEGTHVLTDVAVPADDAAQEYVIDEDTLVSDDTEEEEHDDVIRISMPMMRALITAAMILLLFVFSSIPAGNGSSKIYTCSMIDTEFISSFVANHMPSITAYDALKNDTSTINEQTINCQPDTTAAKTETIAEPQEKEQTATASCFTIVLASKVSRSGAEQFTKSLSTAGFDKSRILEGTKVRKVVYGSYKSKEEAQQSLRSLQQQSEQFEQAWVMEI